MNSVMLDREIPPTRNSGARSDRQAVIDDLYARHGHTLLAYATRLMCDPHHAEDVVQETMLRAWNHADRLTAEHGSVIGWLTRVAHNIAIDKLRARSARPAETSDQTESALCTYANDHSNVVIEGIYVAAALRALTSAHREVLHHVYFHDRTAAETAHRLGLPVGTVKSRIHHALRRLRDALDEMAEG